MLSSARWSPQEDDHTHSSLAMVLVIAVTSFVGEQLTNGSNRWRRKKLMLPLLLLLLCSRIQSSCLLSFDLASLIFMVSRSLMKEATTRLNPSPVTYVHRSLTYGDPLRARGIDRLAEETLAGRIVVNG